MATSPSVCSCLLGKWMRCALLLGFTLCFISSNPQWWVLQVISFSVGAACSVWGPARRGCSVCLCVWQGVARLLCLGAGAGVSCHLGNAFTEPQVQGSTSNLMRGSEHKSGYHITYYKTHMYTNVSFHVILYLGMPQLWTKNEVDEQSWIQSKMVT